MFFLFEPSVYPLYTLGLGLFLLIYLSNLRIKKKKKKNKGIRVQLGKIPSYMPWRAREGENVGLDFLSKCQGVWVMRLGAPAAEWDCYVCERQGVREACQGVLESGLRDSCARLGMALHA